MTFMNSSASTAAGKLSIPAEKPNRKIVGMSAILLPMTSEDQVDWPAMEAHVARTFDAGLAPAVNMDTGFANLIDRATATEVLRRTQAIANGRKFVAGVFVGDQPGDAFNEAAYGDGIHHVQSHGAMPILFQSHGLTSLPSDELVDAYTTMAAATDGVYFFELGDMFAPFGKIYSEQVYEALIQIPQALGAKHSSLQRQLEWDRLAIRDRVRPSFQVLTGNDLAIDMVRWGSDYLLGLSTFAPDAFALRDAYWADGDPRFYELNDLLQYLGFFAFRSPVPAYKHSAAMFLKIRGWIDNDGTYPGSPERPASDREILDVLWRDLNVKLP